MDEQDYKNTLNNINGSIKKWEAIVDGTGHDLQGENCPLCAEFGGLTRCHGCPIKEKTSHKQCRTTPYADFIYHWSDAHKDYCNGPRRVVCRTCQSHAQAEVDFLVALRDEFVAKNKPEEVYYHIGQRFSRPYAAMANVQYILASIADHRVILINLNSGAHWGDGTHVSRNVYITQEELARVCQDNTFTLITELDIDTPKP